MNTSNDVLLKPCPFCGGEAQYVAAYGVRCKACSASLPATHKNHATAWNTRTKPDQEGLTLLREAWAKRTGTVEVTGETVPYLKIHFDSKENMAAFDAALRTFVTGSVA